MVGGWSGGLLFVSVAISSQILASMRDFPFFNFEFIQFFLQYGEISLYFLHGLLLSFVYNVFNVRSRSYLQIIV